MYVFVEKYKKIINTEKKSTFPEAMDNYQENKHLIIAPDKQDYPQYFSYFSMKCCGYSLDVPQ